MARKDQSLVVQVNLQGRKSEEEVPEVALYVLDAARTPQKVLAPVRNGKLELKQEWQKLDQLVAFGPVTDDIQTIRSEGLLPFSAAASWNEWVERRVIDIDRSHWIGWLYRVVCVSGSVKKCTPFLTPISPFPGVTPLPELPPLPGGTLTPRITLNLPSAICLPICQGVIEVYERVCCCRPWVVLDPRLDDLIRKLKDLLHPIPLPDPIPEPGPFPGPRPGPDPSPIARDLQRHLKLREATLDPAVVQPTSAKLNEDLTALKRLPREAAGEYVMARPYLHHILCFPWRCTTRKVGEVTIRPDGTFTFCYTRPLVFVRIGTTCRTTYSYKVKQWHENQWVYIYDGLEAYDWFTSDEEADIRTYNLRARACQPQDPPVPNDKPFVILEDIGSTRSHRLVSPVQNDLDGLNTPLPANGGLVNPPAPGESAVGRLRNQPWSKTLSFRLYVHPGMEALGAKYYRFSIVQADSMGNPAAGETPQPLTTPVTWSRFVHVGGQVQVHGESLGPDSLTDPDGNVQSGLYKIPYWDLSHQWLHAQFHNAWNTLEVANGKHLVIIEIFDSAARRLKPTGATGSGTAKNFDFLHWTTPTTTTKVPFATLVHVFWTDKQPCYGDIEDLRLDGMMNTEECQFLVGTAASTFSAGFRAFHVNGPAGEPFMYYYTIWYHRGLNGPNRTVETSGNNAPPSLGAGAPAVSTPQTFGSMLNEHTKCTFALNLRVYAKHTNGSGRINEYDRSDQAAFALEIGS